MQEYVTDKAEDRVVPTTMRKHTGHKRYSFVRSSSGHYIEVNGELHAPAALLLENTGTH